MKLVNLLYIGCCLPIRFSFVLIAKYIPNKYLPLLGCVALTISIGFFYQAIRNNRNTGAFGQPVWWQHYRPIHALTYLVAASLAFARHKMTYLPLLIDVIIGILVYL